MTAEASLRVGLGMFTGQVPPWSAHGVTDEYRELPQLARLAEDAGYDAFWLSEHHCADDGHLPSPLVVLAAAAAVTERIALGTGMLLAPFYHPLRLAEDCAVLDQLSHGRLILGLGAGWRRREFEAYGMSLDERFRRTVEALEVCRAAWADGTFSFEGRQFSCRDVSVTPKPFAAPTVLLGGTSPVAVARAATRADGFLATPRNRVEDFLSQIALLDEKATAAGRQGTLAIGFHMNVWVSEDGSIPPEVLRAMWHQVGTYAVWHADDDGSPLDEFPPIDEAHLRGRAFAGTPEEVVEQARPWLEPFAGREVHAIFRLHYPGMSLADAEPGIRLFAREVAPELRRISTPASLGRS